MEGMCRGTFKSDVTNLSRNSLVEDWVVCQKQVILESTYGTSTEYLMLVDFVAYNPRRGSHGFPDLSSMRKFCIFQDDETWSILSFFSSIFFALIVGPLASYVCNPIQNRGDAVMALHDAS